MSNKHAACELRDLSLRRGRVLVCWHREGGMRAAAFVSGGLIPVALRGTASEINFHIVDWCECLL